MKKNQNLKKRTFSIPALGWIAGFFIFFLSSGDGVNAKSKILNSTGSSSSRVLKGSKKSLATPTPTPTPSPTNTNTPTPPPGSTPTPTPTTNPCPNWNSGTSSWISGTQDLCGDDCIPCIGTLDPWETVGCGGYSCGSAPVHSCTGGGSALCPGGTATETCACPAYLSGNFNAMSACNQAACCGAAAANCGPTPTPTPTPTETPTPTNTPTPTPTASPTPAGSCPNWNAGTSTWINPTQTLQMVGDCGGVSCGGPIWPFPTYRDPWMTCSTDCSTFSYVCSDGTNPTASCTCPNYMSSNFVNMSAGNQNTCCNGGPTPTPTPTNTPTPTPGGALCSSWNGQPNPGLSCGAPYSPFPHCDCNVNCTDGPTDVCNAMDATCDHQGATCNSEGGTWCGAYAGRADCVAIGYQFDGGCGHITDCKYTIICGSLANCTGGATCCPQTGIWTDNCAADCPPASYLFCSPGDNMCW